MKYKNIKSVAQNLGHSFLSDMNAITVRGQYTIVPALSFPAAARERVADVHLDLIRRDISPIALKSAEIEESPMWYARKLFALCHAQNVEERAIVGASIHITFDYTRARRTNSPSIQETQEFSCTVEIIDDRGAIHQAHPNNWWLG